MIRKLIISLTFDDGFLNHVNIAKELYRHKIHATFFITTNFKGDCFISNRLEAIKIIASLGHEIGSHSVTHRYLIKLPNNELIYEVKESKEILEKIVGRRVYGFAYPFDDFNINVIRVVARYYDYARKGFDPSNLLNRHVNDNGIARYLISSISPTFSISRFIEFIRVHFSHNNSVNNDYGWLVITLHNEPINYILHLVRALRMISSMFGIKVEFKAMCEVLFGEECLK